MIFFLCLDCTDIESNCTPSLDLTKSAFNRKKKIGVYDCWDNGVKATHFRMCDIASIVLSWRFVQNHGLKWWKLSKNSITITLQWISVELTNDSCLRGAWILVCRLVLRSRFGGSWRWASCIIKDIDLPASVSNSRLCKNDWVWKTRWRVPP